MAEPSTEPGGETDLPSCEGCRKRKLKCSRQRPLCSNCEKYNTVCLYEARRNKPGLKTGAVDALSQRLQVIENYLFNREHEEGDDERPSSLPNAAGQGPPSGGTNNSSITAAPVLGILTSLASEIQKLNSNIVWSQDNLQTNSHLANAEPQPQQRKRRRLGIQEEPLQACDVDDETVDSLPSNALLDAIMDFYFLRIQPWIPLIHAPKFQREVQSHDGRQRNAVVLHAMIVATLRHLSPDVHGLSRETVKATIKRSRDYVLRAAMSGLSVENLQAFAIVAFIHIGSGESARAWPIIGSMTRSVQYLQLSVESEDTKQRNSFLTSLPTLPDPENWVEEEERRRVFWNIFILDRFCSVTTGWNNSLTATDVSRRLPVCGGKWYNETPCLTPYFGIWSRSAASLGNSITFLPTHYASPSKASNTDSGAVESPVPIRQRAKPDAPLDISNIGAFAYYIESIESLSRVNTYFLQQEVDFGDKQEVLSWLTRFKELDLRLVHWKMFLPNQWKDSGASREAMPGIMDPNMTAANATHNVSMILLHQKIAYPGPELAGIKLPSSCSAETCLSAAVETANICNQFLEQTTKEVLVTPQLGFCAFISARILLVHWRYTRTELPREFWSMVLNLEEMSRRWSGDDDPITLFLQFALRLRDLHEKCIRNPHFKIDLLGDSEEAIWVDELLRVTPRLAAGTEGGSGRGMSSGRNAPEFRQFNSQADTGVLGSSLPGPITMESDVQQWAATTGRELDESNDDLNAISELLLGQGFSNMDRVISFDDMALAQNGEQWNDSSQPQGW
ncbi:unnamed protein product [Clonostachys rhizophaga]|uniref:Zn(2)-C6 fungal-type domain-containing protein n=1 Tax=Clonostachys rhizophaga TaxID=160324 RepID=A0A9N9VZK5_9HYPO|nr:unnamed protein product [Clonostachys rhizophaga]